MEEDLIIEVWDVFKEYISDKNKETAANHFVDFLLGKDVDTATLKAIVGYDTYLDDAINIIVSGEEESAEDEEDDWSYDEDED
jgi:hypothetical protein